ncbi:MAG: beta-lactamase family protein [Planctomycetes bacterium]|nr:beta-lactamase family protein [Planctomycetota bacterium]
MTSGYVHPRFRPVAAVLRSHLGGPIRGGAAVSVYHRGECVVDIWGGFRDGAGAPWLRDTMALSFSTTKGVTATLAHVLADRGLLDLEAPVARYWPEFAAMGKDRITVRQLLCHQAGLFPLRSRIDRAEEMLDWDHMTNILAASEPAFPPGSRSGYHGLTYGWLVGETIQRAAGRPIGQVLREFLAEPLGLDGLYYGAPASERHRVARLVPPSRWPERLLANPLVVRATAVLPGPFVASRTMDALLPEGMVDFFLSERVLDAPIPSANGVFTARSLARMYAALAGGGAIDGVRLLSRETLRRATRIQTLRLDRVVVVPMLWRLGYHAIPTTSGILPRAFGHFGYGGSGAFADPVLDLSVAMVTSRVAGLPFGDMRIFRISGAAVACARRR